VTDFGTLGGPLEVRQMVLRLVDFFKARGITTMFTSMANRADLEETGVGLSSAFDTWIHLANVQGDLERNRTMVIVKSRGMAHSNQVREFVLTDNGVELVDIYASTAGAFMGTARLAQIAADGAADVARKEGIVSRERHIKEKRRALEARISALRAEFEAETREVEIVIAGERARDRVLDQAKESLSRHREVDQPKGRRSRKDGTGKSA